MEKNALLVALGVITVAYIDMWIVYLRKTKLARDAPSTKQNWPKWDRFPRQFHGHAGRRIFRHHQFDL